jgi:hypothetical protein
VFQKKTLRHITQLRHTVVHRLHITSVQLLKQVHSAYILAEVLQDNECRDKLQTIHSEVDTWVKNMDHDTEVMKQETERKVRQLELMLQQTTIAQQQNEISSAAGQGLINSITTEFGLHHTNAAAEVKGSLSCDEHARSTGGIIPIDEGDIESDENQLQAELLPFTNVHGHRTRARTVRAGTPKLSQLQHATTPPIWTQFKLRSKLMNRKN